MYQSWAMLRIHHLWYSYDNINSIANTQQSFVDSSVAGSLLVQFGTNFNHTNKIQQSLLGVLTALYGNKKKNMLKTLKECENLARKRGFTREERLPDEEAIQVENEYKKYRQLQKTRETDS